MEQSARVTVAVLLVLFACPATTAHGKSYSHYFTCADKTPCPKDKAYVNTWYHCLSGPAKKGCSADKPFPSADCWVQCTDSNTGTKYDTCATSTPCPIGKAGVDSWYYCLGGGASNGCSADKPFPSADCWSQCTVSNNKGVWSTRSGKGGDTWVDDDEEDTDDDWSDGVEDEWTVDECYQETPCPKNKPWVDVWYHCLKGAAYKGCKADAPFPSLDCQKQCKVSKPKTGYSECYSSTPCPKNKSWVSKWYYCKKGGAVNGCSPDKPFPAVDCYDQCTVSNSGDFWGK